MYLGKLSCHYCVCVVICTTPVKVYLVKYSANVLLILTCSVRTHYIIVIIVIFMDVNNGGSYFDIARHYVQASESLLLLANLAIHGRFCALVLSFVLWPKVKRKTIQSKFDMHAIMQPYLSVPINAAVQG